MNKRILNGTILLLMKYIIYLTLVFIVLITGCKKIDELTQFDMEYNETATIPSSTGINLPVNLYTPDVKSNSESTFAINDTRKDLIEEIQLRKLDLTIITPTNGDFGFLKSIELFISATGLSEEKIAWKDNIPADIDNYIELETVDSDLQEYIKKDEFTLRMSTVTDELLTSDYSIDIHSVFYVDAKVLGQ